MHKYISSQRKMLPEIPSDLQSIIPYLQRASEIRARDPVMAYFCTSTTTNSFLLGAFYAANLALTAQRTPEVEHYIIALCEQLEEVIVVLLTLCTCIVICRKRKD